MSLLFKWIWKFVNDPPSLWSRTIQTKYGYNPSFTISNLSIPSIGGPWKNICAHILRHQNAKNLALWGVGENTLFWHDIWVAPLKSLCPRLSKIYIKQNSSIALNGLWEGHIWHWSLEWKYQLRLLDSVELAQLQSLLDWAILSPHDTNLSQVTWMPNKSGSFSVKSINLEHEKMDSHGPIYVIKGLWRGLVPHRIEIFTWLPLLWKINTKDKLARLQSIPSNPNCCVLCNTNPDDYDHLFLNCSFSWSIWIWWVNLWELSWVSPSSSRENYRQWHTPFKDKFFKKSG